MAKVIGLGGLFFQCEDPDATKAFYKIVMGVDQNDYGGWDFSHKAAGEAFPEGGRTIFAPFASGNDYFAPSTLPYMINLMVDDLDGVLARCAEAGIKEVDERQTYDYGHFGWIMDPDGRKVELWQPIEPKG